MTRGTLITRRLMPALLAAGLSVAIFFVLGRRSGRDQLYIRLCRGNIGCVLLACQMYASDHNGRFPDSWSDVRLYAGPVAEQFDCPAGGRDRGAISNVNDWADYVLVGGVTERDLPSTILIYEPLANHGGRGGHIVFANGTIKWCSPADYASLGFPDDSEEIQ